MKRLAKTTVLGLYKYSGAMALQESVSRWHGNAPTNILLFHRVTDAIPPDVLTVGVGFFRDFCRLMERSFHVVSLQDIYKALETKQPLPPRTVAITFDDCYHDNFAAARMLYEHGLPATFFIPTAFPGTDHVFAWDTHLPRMANLTWDDIAAIAKLGHDIGSHTVNHADLGKLDHDEAAAELSESKRTIEDRLGQPCRFLAYPYGGRQHFRPEHFALARELGYEGVVSAFGGAVERGMKDQVLPREAVPPFLNLNHMELYLTGCLDWWYAGKRVAGML